MGNDVLIGNGHQMISVPQSHWEKHLEAIPEHGRERLSFMSPDHHRVRYFVVRELVARARPLEPEYIAGRLELAPERTVEILHEKFTALAEAMPEEDLSYRPMDGVRSVEEVFIHVAADNWWVPAMMGWEAPPETEVTEDPATFTAYQERTMTREEMLEALDASFVFFRESMRESAGDLDRGVSLRGTPAVMGDIWIRATVHLHEHLGQSIAYARANEVVPPWSR